MTIRVALLDDHEAVRRAVRELIALEGDLEVVAEAATCDEILAAVDDLGPDVAICDLRLTHSSGIEACRRIRSSHPATHCLLLTAHASEEALVASLLAGASGYVVKQIRNSLLVESIRAVASGKSLLDRALVAAELARFGDGSAYRLGATETAVVSLALANRTNAEIAAALGIDEVEIDRCVNVAFAQLWSVRDGSASAQGATRR